MKKRKSEGGGQLGEQKINMTPMTDCIFMLLLFFMITTTFIDVNGIIVDLPMGASQSQEEQKKKDVNITVSTTGEYTVDGKIVSAQELPDEIKKAMDMSNNRNIIIQGDPQTAHKNIVYVMDMAQGQGAEGMAFAITETQ